MDFQYSEIVDCPEAQSLSGGITLRRHLQTHQEDFGAIRAQRDWSRYVRHVGGYKGGLGPSLSFISVTVPECLPERLEILSYANEFAFLYDDELEKIGDQRKASEDQRLLDAFTKRDSQPVEPTISGEKQLQAQIFAEMSAIDAQRAAVSMKAWATFIQEASNKRRTESFGTLEEYIPFRVADAGQMFWFGIVTFGMALSIPKEEMQLCRELSKPAYAAMAIVNDLFSFDKELSEAEKSGATHLMNAVWILMKEHSITEAEAKHLCCVKTEEYLIKYQQIVDATKDDNKLSIGLRKYLEALQYSHTGNLAWSLYCPRYRPEVSFNQTQLLMMGVLPEESLETVDPSQEISYEDVYDLAQELGYDDVYDLETPFEIGVCFQTDNLFSKAAARRVEFPELDPLARIEGIFAA